MADVVSNEKAQSLQFHNIGMELHNSKRLPNSRQLKCDYGFSSNIQAIFRSHSVSFLTIVFRIISCLRMQATIAHLLNVIHCSLTKGKEHEPDRRMDKLPRRKLAQKIADTLISQRLAACSNIYAPISSRYHWKGDIEFASEVPLLVKSRGELFDRLCETVSSLRNLSLKIYQS